LCYDMPRTLLNRFAPRHDEIVIMSDKARLQELYAEIQALKKQRKEIKDMIKNELDHHERYQDLGEELKKFKEEKKSIETQVREASPSDSQKLQDIDVELKANEELLSDLAFNLLMADETVEIIDERKNRWVPKFTVKFTKEEG